MVVSTLPGEGHFCLSLCEGLKRPARPGGGEVPRAATGRSPICVRALSMSTRNATSGVGGVSTVSEMEGVMGNCAGIDWASEKHDALIEDPAGGELLAPRVGTARTGSARVVRGACVL